jgi:hypothetical protein
LDKTNPKVRSALLKQEISPEDFFTIDIRQLASDETLKQRSAAEAISLFDKRTDWDQEEVKA